jgi:hypothetical protein
VARVIPRIVGGRLVLFEIANSGPRRIALETYQRCVDAITNKEIEGAEFMVWWERLAGLNQGMAGRESSPKVRLGFFWMQPSHW